MIIIRYFLNNHPGFIRFKADLRSSETQSNLLSWHFVLNQDAFPFSKIFTPEQQINQPAEKLKNVGYFFVQKINKMKRTKMTNQARIIFTTRVASMVLEPIYASFFS